LDQRVPYLSDFDKQGITAAIRATEEKTRAETFCVIARARGDYRLVPIAWAAALALAVALSLINFTSWPAGIIYLIQLGTFIVAALVLSLPILRFRIVPRRRVWERAHAEAMHQFLAQGSYGTERRTGVLLGAKSSSAGFSVDKYRDAGRLLRLRTNPRRKANASIPNSTEPFDGWRSCGGGRPCSAVGAPECRVRAFSNLGSFGWLSSDFGTS
jgi:hypothetical protein